MKKIPKVRHFVLRCPVKSLSVGSSILVFLLGVELGQMSHSGMRFGLLESEDHFFPMAVSENQVNVLNFENCFLVVYKLFF